MLLYVCALDSVAFSLLSYPYNVLNKYYLFTFTGFILRWFSLRVQANSVDLVRLSDGLINRAVGQVGIRVPTR